jgi:surface polysaccharide O-acyltransferase-like enzyme
MLCFQNAEPLMDNPPLKSSMTYSVDFVRTVAILLVIFVHASSFPYSIPGEITPTVMFNWFTSDVYGAIGYLGVPLFVMLSGALLLDPSKADEPMGAFYKKRFNRIGLPLIFWTIVFFAWSYGVYQKPLTLYNLEQGLLSGSYPIMWFLYMLAGLYLATPILRVLVKHLNRAKFKVLLVLWFMGTVTVPLIHTFTSFDYHPVFVFMDWGGYFLLGTYLVNSEMRRSVVYPVLAFGFSVAVLGAWIVTSTVGEAETGFFHGYLSFNMILASAALFLTLVNIPRERIEKGNGAPERFMHWIGQNTLPFYLLHIIVLEVVQLGLLGWRFPYTGIVLIDAPVLAAVGFALSAVIIYVIKKVPYLCKLVG